MTSTDKQIAIPETLLIGILSNAMQAQVDRQYPGLDADTRISGTVKGVELTYTDNSDETYWGAEAKVEYTLPTSFGLHLKCWEGKVQASINMHGDVQVIVWPL